MVMRVEQNPAADEYDPAEWARRQQSLPPGLKEAKRRAEYDTATEAHRRAAEEEAALKRVRDGLNSAVARVLLDQGVSDLLDYPRHESDPLTRWSASIRVTFDLRGVGHRPLTLWMVRATHTAEWTPAEHAWEIPGRDGVLSYRTAGEALVAGSEVPLPF